ncbi:MAG: 50S ribosomal protein L28 [Candidatus Omnitrophota bacterium]
MSKICIVCQKRPMAGKSLARRGQLKKKGGTGSKVTRVTLRIFSPNLQRVKAFIGKTKKRVWVCTKCLKAGKIKKA